MLRISSFYEQVLFIEQVIIAIFIMPVPTQKAYPYAVN